MRTIKTTLEILLICIAFMLLTWGQILLFEAQNNQFLAAFLMFISLSEVLLVRLFLRFYLDTKRKK